MPITLELDKKDLISLVKGKDPGYDLLNHPLVKSGGYFTGGFVDKWTWETDKLKQMSEKDLTTLYFMLKEFGF
jgi:hypothetical protein